VIQDNNVHIQKQTVLALSEILTSLVILSFSLFPIAYIVSVLRYDPKSTPQEQSAFLFANSVFQQIIAKRANNPEFLPPHLPRTPIIDENGNPDSFFFSFLGGARTDENAQLAAASKNFNYQLTTYFVKKNVFKVSIELTYNDGEKITPYIYEKLFSQQ